MSAPVLPEPALSVLIVEDHPLMGQMFSREMTDAGLAVVGVAESAAEGIAMFNRHRPNLVLCDMRLDGSTGLELITSVVRDFPDARIMMISGDDTDDAIIQTALDAGAVGFVSKRVHGPELRRCIADALDGARDIHDRVIFARLVALLRRGEPSRRASLLTKRELEVLEVMASGKSSTKQIAARLVMSEHSVRSHVDHILGKLKVANRSDAVALAFREGIVQARQ